MSIHRAIASSQFERAASEVSPWAAHPAKILVDSQPRFRLKAEKAQAMAVHLGKFALANKKRRARIDTTNPVDFLHGKHVCRSNLR